MPVWKVALLLNLTFAAGLGLGYAGWGRRAAALDRDFEIVRAQVERLERERQACAAGARAGEQQWEGRGLVRAIYPHLLVITHEEIRGLLPARTTSFRVASAAPPTPSALAKPCASRCGARSPTTPRSSRSSGGELPLVHDVKRAGGVRIWQEPPTFRGSPSGGGSGRHAPPETQARQTEGQQDEGGGLRNCYEETTDLPGRRRLAVNVEIGFVGVKPRDERLFGVREDTPGEFVTKPAVNVSAAVKSSVTAYVPDVTPAGKPGSVLGVTATPAVSAKGSVVQQ